MAGKKSPSKAAAPKTAAKAAKPAAAAPKKAASKPAAKKVAAPKKAAPAPKKAAAPAKKAAPAPKKAAAPAKKAAPAPKTAAAPAKKAAPAATPAPAPAKTVKKEAPVQKAAAPEPKKPVAAEVVEPKKEAPAPAAKKPAAPVKGKSSVVDFPAPPAPVKPPFVPPKAPAPKEMEPIASGPNGSHPQAFIQKQKQRLLDLRDELVDAMSGMTRDTIRNAPEGSEASGSGMHQGDAGSDAYDRDFALSVLAKEQDALYEIEQALRRIQAGTYGICEISNRKIPQTRLEVIPFARLTVEEQAQWEKEYGNRRFRPSNEVGFSGGNTSDDEDSDAVSLDEDED